MSLRSFQFEGAFDRDMHAAYDANFSEIFNGMMPTIVPGDLALPVGPGTYILTKGNAAALTLAAPVAGAQNWQMVGGFMVNNGGQDGTRIVILSGSAQQHVLTATGLLVTGSASVNTATCAASAGSALTLRAYNGKWLVESQNQITFG